MHEKEKEIVSKTINNVSFPEHWRDEYGAVEANDISKQNAIKICEILYDFVNSPSIIGSSVESGIYMLFNVNKRYDIYVDSLNNKKVFSIIMEKKMIAPEMIHKEEIKEFDFALTIDKINELKK